MGQVTPTAEPATTASGSESASLLVAGETSGVSASRPHHPVLGKTRSSCDRCHAQKLRCVKDLGSPTCRRCLKLRTICRYSPRAARLSPKPRAKGMEYHQPGWDTSPFAYNVLGNLSSMPLETGIRDGGLVASNNVMQLAERPDAGYPMTDNSVTLNAPWPEGSWESGGIDSPSRRALINWDFTPPDVALKPSLPLVDIFPDSCSSKGTVNSPSSTYERLASLSVQVYECGAKLPSSHKAKTSSASSISCSTGINEARKSAQFIFDELFRLTTEFIDVLTSLTMSNSEGFGGSILITPDQTISPPESSICQSQDVSYLDEAFTETGTLAEPRAPLLEVDEPTIFMIMSCHSRLTETYAAILQMMKMCLEHSLIPQTGSSWVVVLPRLQVGPVALPPLQVDDKTPVSSKATSSMYMITVTMLLSRLWSQLSNVMKEVAYNQSDSISAPASSTADTLWRTALDRTDRLTETIDRIKDQLHR